MANSFCLQHQRAGHAHCSDQQSYSVNMGTAYKTQFLPAALCLPVTHDNELENNQHMSLNVEGNITNMFIEMVQ
jgi:hypothetical protein